MRFLEIHRGGIRCDDVRPAENFAFIGHTKNGDPRPIYLSPLLVAALARHPRGTKRPGERLFRFHKGGSAFVPSGSRLHARLWPKEAA